MFRKILVPLDGSPLAETALPYAEALARASGARLALVRAAVAHSFPGTDPTEAEIRVVEEAEAYLARLAERLAGDGLEVETGVPYGDPVPQILEEVRLRQPDLVVMATHGRSGLGRVVYGSVAEGVLAHCPVPVLLVRAWQTGAQPPFGDGRPRLLVPLDGSLFAEDALPMASRLVSLLDGELVLAQVVEVPGLDMGDGLAPGIGFDLETARREAEAYLAEVARRLAVPAERVVRQVGVGVPAEALARIAREHRVGLVVMASHRRTGLSRLLLGSVADALLRRGEAPLLLVRSAEEPTILKELVPAAEPAVPAEPPLTVQLSPDEVALIRTALRTLSQSVTRHEHLHGRISALLERLPGADEALEERAAEGAGSAG